MSNLDSFSDYEIREIIEYNRELVTRRNESFGIDNEILCFIFKCVNSNKQGESRQDSILRKTSWIIAGITWNQPFNEGNKETAITVGLMFLDRNGFDILMDTPMKVQIYDLLIKTADKFENDPTIYSEVNDFLRNNTTNE